MIPAYINEPLSVCLQVLQNDKSAVMDTSLFDIDPMSCDSRYLPLLAAEIGVDINLLPVSVQRIVLASHRWDNAGTRRSAEDVIASLGIDATIVEGYGNRVADGTVTADGSFIADDGSFSWSDIVVYVDTPLSFANANRLSETLRRVIPARSAVHRLIYNTTLQADGSELADGQFAAGSIGEAYV